MVAAFLFSAAAGLGAHEDLELQIAGVTREIEREPRNAELYLRRGELHRFHEDWPKAEADYRRVEELDAGLTAVDLARGRMLLASGHPERAKEALDRFISRRSSHPEGWLERGRALIKMGRRREGAADFTRGMELAPVLLPEHFVERAEALAAAGDREAALRGLDEGIRKLGPLVSLELPAIDLDLALGRTDAALARIEALSKQTPRKEPWLARRGEILLQAGRAAEAREAFQAALAAIEALPAARRKARATADLEARVRAALAP